MSYLTVKGLEKRYCESQKELVIAGLDLTLEPGDIYCLLGANGSGKTTLLKTILGLYPPDKGQVLFFDGPLTNKVKCEIGYVSDTLPRFPAMKVGEFMELSLKLYGHRGTGIKDYAATCLNKVGLYAAREKRLSDLSKGMERRLGLAQVMSHEPDLLILDEPIEGMDVEGLLVFENYLYQCQEKKRAVLFTTHLYTHVKDLATRVGILHKGKIIEKDAQDQETVNWSLATCVLEKRMYDEGGFLKC